MDRTARNVDEFARLEHAWRLPSHGVGDFSFDYHLPLITVVRMECVAGAAWKMKLHLHPHLARWVVLERRGEETPRNAGPVGDVDVCADAAVAIVPASATTAKISIDLNIGALPGLFLMIILVDSRKAQAAGSGAETALVYRTATMNRRGKRNSTLPSNRAG